MASQADAHCNAGRRREKRDVEHIAQRGARNRLARLPGWRIVARWCGARSDSGPPVGKEACGSRRTVGMCRSPSVRSTLTGIGRMTKARLEALIHGITAIVPHRRGAPNQFSWIYSVLNGLTIAIDS